MGWEGGNAIEGELDLSDVKTSFNLLVSLFHSEVLSPTDWKAFSPLGQRAVQIF